MNFLARAVAVIFHPLFMPLFSAWFFMTQIPYFKFAIPEVAKSQVYLILIVLVVFQVISFGIMKGHKIISDYQVNDHKQRGTPIIMVLLYYVLAYFLFKSKQSTIMLPLEIYDMLLGVIISLIVAFIISKWYKMSLHMLGVCGTVGVITGLSMQYEFDHSFHPLFWVYLMIGIAGLVGASRIYTGNHSFSEIVSGGIVGFMINYLIMS